MGAGVSGGARQGAAMNLEFQLPLSRRLKTIPMGWLGACGQGGHRPWCMPGECPIEVGGGEAGGSCFALRQVTS